MGCWPLWSCVWLGPMLAAPPASPERTVLQITSLGKDPNSQFKVQFLRNAYRFHTITKSRNPKSNHLKSRTICMTYYNSSCPYSRVGIKPFRILQPLDYMLTEMGLPGEGKEGRSLVRSEKEGIEHHRWSEWGLHRWQFIQRATA